jgi:L-cysteine/cystine lyase
MYVGLGWMFERGARLTELLAGRLASIRGVELLAAGRPRGTILALRVAGWRAPEVARELGQRAFAIVQPVPALDAVRLSVGFFNTEAELERVAETVELLAEHRPETLPPRPSLTVLGGEPAGGR